MMTELLPIVFVSVMSLAFTLNSFRDFHGTETSSFHFVVQAVDEGVDRAYDNDTMWEFTGFQLQKSHREHLFSHSKLIKFKFNIVYGSYRCRSCM